MNRSRLIRFENSLTSMSTAWPGPPTPTQFGVPAPFEVAVDDEDADVAVDDEEPDEDEHECDVVVDVVCDDDTDDRCLGFSNSWYRCPIVRLLLKKLIVFKFS